MAMDHLPFYVDYVFYLSSITSKTADVWSDKKPELLAFRRHLGCSLNFYWDTCCSSFQFFMLRVCGVFLLLFVFVLCRVSNVVSGLPLRFSLTFIQSLQCVLVTFIYYLLQFLLFFLIEIHVMTFTELYLRKVNRYVIYNTHNSFHNWHLQSKNKSIFLTEYTELN